MVWECVITGCGTSHGNPPWGVPASWSTDPRDRRRRSGAILRGPADEVVLLDIGPDLADQLRDPYRDWDGLSYPARCVTSCDGVLLTHDHADHMHGINELRHLNRLMGGDTIRIFGAAEHLSVLRGSFPYCFPSSGEEAYQLAVPHLATVAIDLHQPFRVAGIDVLPLPTSHGPAGPVTAYRIGELAYCTDCKIIPDETLTALHGVDLLVLDMLREKEHPTHMNFDEAMAVVETLKPRQTVLVHTGHEVRYAEWQHRLPDGVVLAVDGWSQTFDADAGGG